MFTCSALFLTVRRRFSRSAVTVSTQRRVRELYCKITYISLIYIYVYSVCVCVCLQRVRAYVCVCVTDHYLAEDTDVQY